MKFFKYIRLAVLTVLAGPVQGCEEYKGQLG